MIRLSHNFERENIMTRQERKQTLKILNKLTKHQRYDLLITSAKVSSSWPEDKPLNVKRTMSFLKDVNKPYNKSCVICDDNITSMTDSHNAWPVVVSDNTFKYKNVTLSEDEDNVCCSHCNATVVMTTRSSNPEKYCMKMTKAQHDFAFATRH